jgi:predicted PurR-regulated permease PerM
MLGGLTFVLFVALYVAWAPEPYRRGILSLVQPDRQDRARAVLDRLASTVRRWMLGRLVSMTAVGVVTALGLWALGIPAPGTLGLLAGVLGFVPNIGPLVSVVPAALLALTVGTDSVLLVLGFYLLVNLADGYALTPWVQKKAVSIPPALIITGQVLAGTFWGLLGVVFATPLLACFLVLVRELYVKNRDQQAEHGPAPSPPPHARAGPAP